MFSTASPDSGASDYLTQFPIDLSAVSCKTLPSSTVPASAVADSQAEKDKHGFVRGFTPRASVRTPGTPSLPFASPSRPPSGPPALLGPANGGLSSPAVSQAAGSEDNKSARQRHVRSFSSAFAASAEKKSKTKNNVVNHTSQNGG